MPGSFAAAAALAQMESPAVAALDWPFAKSVGCGADVAKTILSQVPAEQFAFTHLVPHAPQFDGSVIVSTHAALALQKVF